MSQRSTLVSFRFIPTTMVNLKFNPKVDSLHTFPKVEATFRFIESQNEPHSQQPPIRCSGTGSIAIYNNLHETFSDYQAQAHQNSLPLLDTPDESENFSKLQLGPIPSNPRLLRLNSALSQLNRLQSTTDVLTNRGDLNDIAMSFFPHFLNNYEKIHHVAYIKHGRLFFWHDCVRDETFNSSRSRNNWYSGYKFEAVCAHQWPDDGTKWCPLPKLSNTESPVLSLLHLPLRKGLQAMILAEYDVALPKVKGLAKYVELKCFQPPIGNINAIQWQALSNAEVLEALINKKSFMKFFKTCLQCKLAGCENVVYGIRNSAVSLVGVRQFNIMEIESRLQTLEKTFYHRYYLKALQNISDFMSTLFKKCEEGEFYMVTKNSPRAPLRVQKIKNEDLLFKVPFTAEFESLLKRTEAERRQFRALAGDKQDASVDKKDASVDKKDASVDKQDASVDKQDAFTFDVQKTKPKSRKGKTREALKTEKTGCKTQKTSAYTQKARSKDQKTSANTQEVHSKDQMTSANTQEVHSKDQMTSANTQEVHSKDQMTSANTQKAHPEDQKTSANTQKVHSKDQKTSANTQEAHSKDQMTSANTQKAHPKDQKTSANTQKGHPKGQKATANTQKAPPPCDKLSEAFAEVRIGDSGSSTG
ncbi:LANO_0H19988g1_1 [Lachancea nothofagi CBS 11611]|uniref:Decapping nuclease n=1 Tax=Lachancea nothofagi CBS 11611 TaxID=1266666 RepID=A0A1G4KN78_9SACH|nr:LANO_0H19988g1_1 [Lachancea nothofagi CBS 11611]